MNLTFDLHAVETYKSPSQRIRVMSEQWVSNSIYCPNCGNPSLDKCPNNQPVADFSCSNCSDEYELKSMKGAVGVKIGDGAYRTMMERLSSADRPNLFLLSYDLRRFEVQNLFVIPKHFFVPGMIERRNPLGATARRAGWVGCNILLQDIPNAGKIFIIRNRQIEPKEKLLAEWQRTLFLREAREMAAKGWLLDVMLCVDRLGKAEFSLADVYVFESELSRRHPDNQHVRDKIRQQLQVLRDKKYLEFLGRGKYRLTQASA